MKTFKSCNLVAFSLVAALCVLQTTGAEALAAGRTLNLNSRSSATRKTTTRRPVRASQGPRRQQSLTLFKNGPASTSRDSAIDDQRTIWHGSTAQTRRSNTVTNGQQTVTTEAVTGELRGRVDVNPTFTYDPNPDPGEPIFEAPSIGVQGEANLFRAGVNATSDDGNGNTADFSAGVAVGAKGEAGTVAKIDEDGLKVGVGAGASVGARADVSLETNAEDAVLGVADVKTDSGATAMAGAAAEAEGTVGIGKKGVTAQGEAGAFAGARAGGDVGGSVGGVGGRAEGEAWAGVGAEAEGEASFENGKLVFGGKLGAGLGVGGKVGAKVEIDFNEVGETVTNTAAKVDQGAKEIDKGIDFGLTQIENDLGLDSRSQARDRLDVGISLDGGRPQVNVDLNLAGTERVLRIGGAVVEQQLGNVGEAFAGIQLPPVQLPPIELPPIQIPEFQLPPVNLPPVQLPDFSRPPIQIPPIQIPEFKLPPIQVPTIQPPKFQLPKFEVPKVQVPKFQPPQIQIPEIKVPEIKVPEIKVPEIKIPEIKIPPIKVPEIKFPF